MTIEYIRYQIDPSQAQAFGAAYASAAEQLRASSHCLGYELTCCVEDPGSYILRIQWDSVAGHLQGFRTSAEFKPFFSAIQPYVKNIQEMRHYALTDLCWSRT